MGILSSIVVVVGMMCRYNARKIYGIYANGRIKEGIKSFRNKNQSETDKSEDTDRKLWRTHTNWQRHKPTAKKISLKLNRYERKKIDLKHNRRATKKRAVHLLNGNFVYGEYGNHTFIQIKVLSMLYTWIFECQMLFTYTYFNWEMHSDVGSKKSKVKFDKTTMLMRDLLGQWEKIRVKRRRLRENKQNTVNEKLYKYSAEIVGIFESLCVVYFAHTVC